MKDIWFTADQHFNHERIIRYCDRPFSCAGEMNEYIIQEHNTLVKPGDTVYMLGDFAFKNHFKFASRLTGKKVFIVGNHDKMAEEELRGFSRVVGGVKAPGILEISVDNRHVTLCHFPMESWNGSFHGSWHLHGHCHGRLESPDRYRLDVGVDTNLFRLYNWDEIVTAMGRKVLRERDEDSTATSRDRPGTNKG